MRVIIKNLFLIIANTNESLFCVLLMSSFASLLAKCRVKFAFNKNIINN